MKHYDQVVPGIDPQSDIEGPEFLGMNQENLRKAAAILRALVADKSFQSPPADACDDLVEGQESLPF